MNEEQQQAFGSSYYPRWKCKLTIYLEDLGKKVYDGKAPAKAPTKLKGKADEREVLDRIDDPMAPPGVRRFLLLPKSRSAIAKNGGPQTQILDERLVYILDNIVPHEFNLSRNSIRMADTLTMSIRFIDMPIDPRLMRSCGVTFYLGCVSPEEHANGIAENRHIEDGTPDLESLGSLADGFVDKNGVHRTNERFHGFIDKWTVTWATNGEPMINVDCRDNTQLMIDMMAPKDLHIDPKLPVDEAIGDYLTHFPQMAGMSIEWRGSGTSGGPKKDEKTPAPDMTPRPRVKLDDDAEKEFRAWYADISKKWGLDKNPDDPEHHYDYRAAWQAGAEPDPEADGHWPSTFKAADHPNRFVNGEDTITGEPIPKGWTPASSKSSTAPTLQDALSSTTIKFDLGPPPKQTGAGSLTVWDYITDVLGVIGLHPRVEGNVLVIQEPRTLFTAKSGNTARGDDPFDGRDGNPYRQFIYGRNILSMDITRNYSKQKPMNIEMHCYQPGRKSPLIVQYPPPEGKQIDVKGHAEQKWHVRTVRGVKDKATLLKMAQQTYEMQGRNEVEINVKTKDLASLGGNNTEPDILYMQPGDSFELFVNRDEEELQSNSMTQVEAALVVMQRGAKFLRRLGFPENFANEYAQLYVDAGFQTAFRTKSITFAGSMHEGVSIDVIGMNYIEVVADRNDVASGLEDAALGDHKPEADEKKEAPPIPKMKNPGPPKDAPPPTPAKKAPERSTGTTTSLAKSLVKDGVLPKKAPTPPPSVTTKAASTNPAANPALIDTLTKAGIYK